jgi:hypothetical protein
MSDSEEDVTPRVGCHATALRRGTGTVVSERVRVTKAKLGGGICHDLYTVETLAAGPCERYRVCDDDLVDVSEIVRPTETPKATVYVTPSQAKEFAKHGYTLVDDSEAEYLALELHRLPLFGVRQLESYQLGYDVGKQLPSNSDGLHTLDVRSISGPGLQQATAD